MKEGVLTEYTSKVDGSKKLAIQDNGVNYFTPNFRGKVETIPQTEDISIQDKVAKMTEDEKTNIEANVTFDEKNATPEDIAIEKEIRRVREESHQKVVEDEK